MPYTNSWLCIYAIGQLGRPYLMGSRGAAAKSTQKQLKQNNYVATSSYYTNPNYNKSVKHHDCSGLVLAAMTCSSINGSTNGKYPVAHGATSQYNANCKTKANNMKNFPKIPGTLVFHSNGSIKTHVGIYVGTFIDKKGKKHTNAVIEAMGRNWGVVYSSVSNSKWNAWGQLSLCKKDTKVGDVFDARTGALVPPTASAAQSSSSTSSSSSSTTSSTNPLASSISSPTTILTKNMQPFVATILAGNNPKLDYGKIRDARISAMMFFGGELFDASHTKKSVYVNPYLDSQIQQCNSAGMPYALYVNVRARTVIEADEECRTLYYVVSEYLPKLGLWLSLQTNNTVEVNNSILEVYYKYIDSWGLRARCGLYMTANQLDKITWNTFKDRFYLWEISPMDIARVDTELLQPSMFEVPD